MSLRLVWRLLSFLCLFFCSLFFISGVEAATVYVNSTTGSDSSGVGSVGNPYRTFHKAYVSSTAGDTLDLTGTFNWSDSAETGDSSTSGYTIAKQLTLLGHGPTSTIFQPTSTENVADRRVFTVTASTTFQDLTIRYGKVASSNSGGGVSVSVTSTFVGVEIYGNRNSGGWGGGIYSTATTTIISNSAIYSNVTYYGGGGVSFFSTSTGQLYITNTTIAFNQRTASSGNTEGAGVNIWNGSGSLTNVTITKNIAGSSTGNAGFSMNDPNGYITVQNTIIAGNTGSTYEFGYRQTSYGNVIDRGYNIIAGSNTYYTWASSTDWKDVSQTGVFTKYGTSVTGTLQLDTALSLNDYATYRTKTVALLSATSVAVNNGTTTANGLVPVPNLDQRGGIRNGETDIGAFEFNASGLTVETPSVQSYSIVTSSVQYKQFTLNWSNGDGARRVVFIKQASSGTAAPVDGTRYTASTTFGVGDQIGASGWYAVYDGLGATTTVTGIMAGTDYRVQIFEYNGVTFGTEDYLTDTATANPVLQQSYTPTTVYCNYSTGNDTTGTGSSSTPYKTFNKCYTTSNGGDTLNLAGTFDWSNSDETGDATTSGYTIAKDLYIIGQGADETVIQATSTINTATRRVFTISGVSTTFQDISIQHGKVTGGSDSGGGIYTTGPMTLERTEIRFNTSSAYFGGGVYSASEEYLRVSNSAIYNNMAYYGGGGISFFSTSSGQLYLTNTTIYNNTRTATVGNTEGAGVNIWKGSGTFTNVSITGNRAPNGSGNCGFSMNDPTGYVAVQNTIVAGNTGSTIEFGYRQTSYGNVIDRGYNIIAGSNTYYTWASSTDWKDTSQSGTFTKYGTSVTGTLQLDTSLALNSAVNGTKTIAIMSSSSIAFNNGTSTPNGVVTVPTTDQRGATRLSGADIGAYEFGGTFENTYYTFMYTAGAGGSITGSSTQSVLSGSNGTTVTATPSTGYTFSQWSDSATTTSRMDTNASVNLSLTAQFTTTTFSVTYVAGTGGSVTGSSTQTIFYGQDASTVVTTPNTGYSFVQWSDGVLTASRTDVVVIANIAVTAQFTTTTFSVTYTAGTGGSVTGSTSQTVSYGADATTVVAVPTTGYTFLQWSDGVTSTSRTDISVVAIISVTAQFSGGSTPSTGGSAAAAPAGRGDGVADRAVGIGGMGNIGLVTESGVNSLSYINSISEFQAVVSSLQVVEAHRLVITNVDLSKKLVTFTVYSEPQEFSLAMGESVDIDLERDGVADVRAKFADLWVNRVELTLKALPRQSTVKEVGQGGVPVCDSVFSVGLRQRSSHVQVRDLQKCLNELGFLVASDGSGSKGQETMYFGAQTKAALIRFQQSRQLPTTGWLDKPTRTALGGVLAVVSTPISKTSVVTNIIPALTRNLEMGLAGPDVSELQKWLNFRGYQVPVTGYFGAITKAALIDFQNKEGIKPAQGYLGPATRAVLMKVQ